MDWKNLLNASRLGGRKPKTELGRSPFNSDHDKIIFSGAFRRLGRKTQVHPLATNDHIHNRLTHSLEVSCVGRSLGILVGLKLEEKGFLPQGYRATDIGDIVQSTCLAHDIGNPPFGHTGEEAIKSWFAAEGAQYLQNMSPEERFDMSFFEGNAQGFRVLTSGENHINDGGMRLTYATLASFIKYPWTAMPAQLGQRPKKDKYGVYLSELNTFHEVANAVGLIQQDEHWYCRHPLVHLMESADDFCYGIVDLEDGLEMAILDWDDMYDILKPVVPADQVVELEREMAKLPYSRRPPLLRGTVIGAYVEAASDAFIKHYDQYLQGDPTNLIDLCEEPIKTSILQAKETAKNKIYNDPRKIGMEVGSYNVISTLLKVMCESAFEWIHTPDKMCVRSRRVIDLIGESTFDPKIKLGESELSRDYLAMRRVVDYLGGMTDNYAVYLAKQFTGMGL